MKKYLLLLLLPLTLSVVSCDDDDEKTKDVSITSSVEVLSCHSVILNGYANGANGKVGFCYSATNESPDPETCACVETSSIMLDNSYQIIVDGLMPATKYYYRAFATKNHLMVMAAEVKSFTTEEFKQEAVDLGLSVKWANCNLGATAPEEYGDYFAWGETTPKEYYAWNTYFDTTDDGNTFTKYNNDGGLTVLEPADDAATANLGGDWRMPTKEEIDELNNNCTCCWTTLNGVRGYKVIGKNGNSIFFPASGYRFEDYVDCEGVYGSYWSSTLSVSHTHGAYDFYFYTGYIDCYSGRRCGRPVRAVCK